MKNFSKFFVVAVVLLAFLIIPKVGISEESKKTGKDLKIAFVQMEKVTQNYYKWVDLQEKYKNDLQYYQNKINQMQQDFENLKKSGASQEVLTQKQQELQVRVSEYQKAIQDEYTQKTNKILDEVKNKVIEYAKENGYNLVLYEPSVIYADELVDITAQIIEMLKK
ncbi:periplasmic chaperone for outer membrane proteins Skp [Marinitoga hydrogenitolerans DSM 16785]|uniref:Periplasmic chaperone for outer membrane proteins Skp n=1 Tax=Marinitoga hydrogenitolerans (strain DSM 16785 / JCM 12826 / AT1271) TaxID=1122195 RepID=A0A1M4UAV2_MARH1|nr:OmpH family outer membrane protein [Marinitoga hydrogenitolerans]SHE53680.1 periplasmic chaperone for outer membrane proteins Skp [Marinitoga hydrogenitolerans DSM 16785]